MKLPLLSMMRRGSVPTEVKLPTITSSNPNPSVPRAGVLKVKLVNGSAVSMNPKKKRDPLGVGAVLDTTRALHD